MANLLILEIVFQPVRFQHTFQYDNLCKKKTSQLHPSANLPRPPPSLSKAGARARDGLHIQRSQGYVFYDRNMSHFLPYALCRSHAPSHCICRLPLLGFGKRHPRTSRRALARLPTS
ncbi:hypothetical protein HZ326_24468 [Fusarium oxysporum f. sp. albedinis]|nr:hypothetical protein HZ326_24468 [Fusarium oxysporum f. sp. albedinis]